MADRRIATGDLAAQAALTVVWWSALATSETARDLFELDAATAGSIRPSEERDLAVRFGSPSERDRAAVRCWIPTWPPYRP